MSELKQKLFDWIARYVPTCEVTTHRISLAQDGKLSWWHRLMTRLHLAVCTWCTKYHKQVTFITDATRARASDADTTLASRSTLPTDARDRIKQALRDSKSE